MKQKDFKNHDWKEGDILYGILYLYYNDIRIPYKIIRFEVDKVCDHYVFVKPCDKRYIFSPAMFGCKTFFSLTRASECMNYFLTKKDAIEELEKKSIEFKSIHAHRIKEKLSLELKCLDKRKGDICRIMRMNIMK